MRMPDCRDMAAHSSKVLAKRLPQVGDRMLQTIHAGKDTEKRWGEVIHVNRAHLHYTVEFSGYGIRETYYIIEPIWD